MPRPAPQTDPHGRDAGPSCSPLTSDSRQTGSLGRAASCAPSWKSRQEVFVPNAQGTRDEVCSQHLDGPETRLERLATGPESHGP